MKALVTIVVEGNSAQELEKRILRVAQHTSACVIKMSEHQRVSLSVQMPEKDGLLPTDRATIGLFP